MQVFSALGAAVAYKAPFSRFAFYNISVRAGSLNEIIAAEIDDVAFLFEGIVLIIKILEGKPFKGAVGGINCAGKRAC